METNFKTYGLTKINNDHFLTLAGSFGGVCNGVAKIGAGLLSDRMETKKILIGFLTLQLIVNFTLPIVSENKYFFFIAVCLS